MEGGGEKRAPNFCRKEEAFLVKLIKKYKNIIECKISDVDTNENKNTCWRKIEVEFNSVGDVFRSHKVLRKKYDNIKKRTKKKFADEKCYALGTGGGPSKNIIITGMDRDIKEILGVRMEGHRSEFDGDSQQLTNHDQSEAMALEENLVDMPPVDPTENLQNGNWSTYNPKMLRSKKTAAITPHRGMSRKGNSETLATKRLAQWAAAKENVEQSRNTFLQEEQTFKLKAMKEKHELEMLLMREKAETEAIFFLKGKT